MTQPPPLIAANWKMNGVESSLAEVRTLLARLHEKTGGPRVAICPPSTLIERLARLVKGSIIEVGGQACRAEAAGAFTGDLSAAMLADAGARLVIVGHSERRAAYGETDDQAAAQASAALGAGLEPIICVGESLEQRRRGEAVSVVERQVRASTAGVSSTAPMYIAYEPIWAIGSGLTPSLDDIAAVHSAIRGALRQSMGEAGLERPILYGGSVTPANAGAILALAEVDGALVGGASLKAESFYAIIENARARVR